MNKTAKRRDLRPGDEVTVFYDPMKEEHPEDRAVLVELVQDAGDRQEWVIRFIAKDWHRTYKRWIKGIDEE